MRDLSRRGLFRVLAASGAAAMAGCGKKLRAVRVAPVPAGWQRGEERWVASTCGQCAAGCGIRVRVYEGRAVKIEGNRDHPVNGGGLGPKGQAGLQLLHHPNRIRGPLRRFGPRGSGRWVSITWDEAIDGLAAALRALRDGGKPERLVVIDGERRGPVPRLWERFLTAYGSPNHVTHASATNGATVLATGFMHGIDELPAYDWARAGYVLGFGSSLFESSCHTIHMARAVSAMRGGDPGRRVKFVQVSPDFSVTAAKSDEWIAIEPATYGALALGLAHVLVRDNLYDADFVRIHTFGFDAWRDQAGRNHRGFRDLLLSDYPPAVVQHMTGVPVATIERLAHEMAAHRPAIVVDDGTASAATNGLGTAMAIHALNALVGSIERRGGVFVRRPPLSSWEPPVEADELAQRGLGAEPVDGRQTRACPLGAGSIQRVPEAILSGRPYPVGVLILYRSNPLFSKPEGQRWLDAIRHVPLVVSCSPLADESTLWADVVLPDHTYLERWELAEPASTGARAVVDLRQPVVPPRHNTLATGDVIIGLARAISGSVAKACPWTDYREANLEELKRIAPDPAVLLKDLQKTGAWCGDETFERWDDAFLTPSRKFEFYSQAIANRIASLFPSAEELDTHLSRSGVTTRGDDLCLPHWEPPRFVGDAGAYPFLLAPYRGINYAEGGVRHLPALREMPAAGLLAWKEVVDLNPDDAQTLGVSQGDEVWIESPVARQKLAVRVHAGTRRGTIGLPLGHGPWPPTPEDAGRGGYGLLAPASDPLAGVLAYQGTRVRVRKEA